MNINEIINDLFTNCLHPQILLPTRISGNVKLSLATCSKNVTTGNTNILLLVYLITFHSFSFLPDFFSRNYTYKKNAELNDWSIFNKNSFLYDFNITNWNSVMEIAKNNVNVSFNS